MGEDRMLNNINTDRLILREIREEDAEIIVAMRGDEEVYRYFKKPHKVTIGEHLSWYKNSYLTNENRIDFVAVIADKAEEGSESEGEIVGVFGLQRAEEKAKTAEVSYILDKSHRGKGYASEAIKALMEYAEKLWGCKEFEAIIHKENEGSVKFIKALGYELKNTDGDFCCYGAKI